MFQIVNIVVKSHICRSSEHTVSRVNYWGQGLTWERCKRTFWHKLNDLKRLGLQKSICCQNPLNKTYVSTCSMCFLFSPFPTSVAFLLLLDNLPNKLSGQSPCLRLCSQENQAEACCEKCARLIHIQQT